MAVVRRESTEEDSNGKGLLAGGVAGGMRCSIGHWRWRELASSSRERMASLQHGKDGRCKTPTEVTAISTN